MKLIENFNDVIYYLQQKEIVFKVDKNKPTFFLMIQDNKIRVSNENSNYFITLDELRELFQWDSFCLYDSDKLQEEFVSEIKDMEYYSWKHK